MANSDQPPCMFSHVVLGSNDIDRSRTFYDATLGVMGVKLASDGEDRLGYRAPEGPPLIIMKPLNGEPATHANGGTVGFSMGSSELVDAWHAAGCANGGTSCEDPPGLRDFGFAKLYVAYLRDPDGNKLGAAHVVGDPQAS